MCACVQGLKCIIIIIIITGKPCRAHQDGCTVRRLAHNVGSDHRIGGCVGPAATLKGHSKNYKMMQP